MKTEATIDGMVERLVARWPSKIRREIFEWFGGACCGHGGPLSKPAYRRWRYLCDKLSDNL